MKPPTACRWLQTKAWFFPPLADGARVPSDDGVDPEELHGTPFWCNQTQDSVGPDGALVCREDCAPGRGCFEQTLAP